MKTLIVITLGLLTLFACSPEQPKDPSNYIQKTYGKWIKETNDEVMLDPQPSGLTLWRNKLLTVSDRSAHESQRLKLRTINPKNAKLVGPDLKLSLSNTMQSSCFASYLSGNPDLEALTVDPDNDKVFYVVTEDASYAEPLSEACKQQFLQTGSTDYPTLLVRIELINDEQAKMTHVRPVQFSQEMHIGDFPNDGIEALTFGKNRTLFLGIEKDENKKARVFSLQLDENFWHTDDFALVTEVPLKLPQYKAGNHPINAMDYYQTADGKEYLILAARNDEALWVADIKGEKQAKIVPLEFYAEVINGTGVCKNHEPMDNSSIEGLAVQDDILWMVNDPWKAVYLNNVRCPQNKEHYKKFAPLLFKVPISKHWFN